MVFKLKIQVKYWVEHINYKIQIFLNIPILNNIDYNSVVDLHTTGITTSPQNQPFPKVFLISIQQSQQYIKKQDNRTNLIRQHLKQPNTRPIPNFSSETSSFLNIRALLSKSLPLMKWCQPLSKLEGSQATYKNPSQQRTPVPGHHSSKVKCHHFPLPLQLHSLAVVPTQFHIRITGTLTNAQVHTRPIKEVLGTGHRLQHFYSIPQVTLNHCSL